MKTKNFPQSSYLLFHCRYDVKPYPRIETNLNIERIIEHSQIKNKGDLFVLIL